ncbi:linoleate diol synthase (Linoleate (8R)-dioxygenase) [Coccidioides immitis H538.4]|uniref:Linoleate diol synthase (Linoleate (8R)-dioxygenase) n=1 Tax=Coccidioides immitis H538.4 TaxID=396776 RepID=A0A0J8S4R9_COCIT|nr:linoleate diol synthase (Linoleate (8R)-dioxygenase) [Coccidioides immitis H538.4]
MSTTNGHSNGIGHTNGTAAGTKASRNGIDKVNSRKSAVKRPQVESTFKQYAQLIHAARRPLPKQSGDGTYLTGPKAKTSLLQDLRSMGPKGWGTLIAVLKNKRSGDLTDDKTYIMERIIHLVAGLPPESNMRTKLTNSFVTELWNTLPHPSVSAFGDEYMYRSADGSNNNPLFPKLGAANTPYARSIIPSTIQLGALPDPGLIFDSIFAREEFKPHPNGVSSMFFAWASLIIHDLFQTDHRNPNISQTSSYLDLSTLYGDNQEDQNQVRTFKDGKLKPDCFSEPRLLALPPVCSVILVMLNRFHNYVAEQLAHINEGGRFSKPRTGLSPEESTKAWAKYDTDLFQTARLVTCGLYINITLYDYVRTIINLTRSNTTWCLDPRVNMRDNATPEAAASGTGNQCSVEFNLAYRWHSCIGQQDERWTEGIYQELFGKPAGEVSMPDLLMGMKKWQTELPKDPSHRSFAGLKRDSDGRFNDDDLVKIMTESTEEIAGSFGPRNVPKALRAVEILGIQQARKWGCGSLNEFRKFFGLKEYTTFEEINSDPYIADQLRHLYEHPDHVELYPGIVAEEPKIPMVPGAGICPTYTLSRAILSDAVALVRGDRFYTTDYHPKSLTNWGYSETHYDLNINQGCVFYKLILRSFPNHFKPDSIYAHYPMTIPSENKKIFAGLGRESHFSWEKPAFIPPRVNLTSYLGAKTILDNAKDFRVTWGEATGFLFGTGGLNFMLSGDSPKHAKQRQLMGKALYHDEWKKQVKQFYEDITIKLLRQKSYKVAGVNQVDITRDVGNLAHVHFASNIFSLPLKTEKNPRGIYTEHEMFMVMCVVFTCIFFDLDPAKSFPLRQAARVVAQQLGKIVEGYVKSVKVTSIISGIVDRFRKNETALKDYGIHMIRRLLASGQSVSEVTWSQVMPTAGAMVPNQAQVFTQIIDYYLSEEGRIHLPDIQRLAHQDTPESDDKLLHYCMEAIRLNGTFGSYREATTAMEIDDDGRHVSIKPGDKVFVSFVSANRDPDIFPNPNEVRLDRPLDSYIHYGEGPHTCLGRDANMVALTSMLRVIGKLKNLRRAPGPQGELKKVPRPGGFYIYMREDHGSYFVFPMTFKVHFDGELPEPHSRPA